MITSILLNVLINKIVNEYLPSSYCVLILTDEERSISLDSNVLIVNIKVINSTLPDHLIFHKYGCQDIIIHHSNSSIILVELERKMKLHSARFNRRKYIIVADNLDIFNLNELHYIVNLLVILPSEATETECFLLDQICYEHGIFQLLTHKYVGKSNSSDPEVVDFWATYNRSFTYGNNLFPEKLQDQHGRFINCATFNYKPYSIIGDSPLTAIGSENAIANEFAKMYNMTINYILDDKEWGIIYDNWTGDGILGNVATDMADIGYGALYTWAHEYRFLDLSKPVVRTGITCLVPSPRLTDGWLTPLLPFSLEMWLYFVLSLILIFITLFGSTTLISKRKRKQKTVKVNYAVIYNQIFIRITKIFLVQSVATTNKSVDIALKYMFTLFLYSLVISASYSSGLAAIMTIPRYTGVINTVKDLANSDIKWGATQDAWIYSILEEQRPEYVKILDKFIPTEEENLLRMAKTKRFAFSIERLPSGQYAIGNYITEDVVKGLRLMQEDLYWEYCVFMLRKSSPLLENLDSLIIRLNEIGLIIYWEKKTTEVHMNSRVQNIVGYYRASQTKEPDHPVVKLQWIHVEGAFGILILGYILSAICFIIELIYYKYSLSKITYLC
ncbi:hypothetical protein FQA39_LY17354 [Lamprigera yunnana]|nr:hypothetical protein FQA39_LY17354 [Lamprigera yunnana]